MTLCTLPPVSLLTERYPNTDASKLDSKDHSSRSATSSSASPSPASSPAMSSTSQDTGMTDIKRSDSASPAPKGERLPGFKELLQSIEGPIGAGSPILDARSPPKQYSSTFQPSRPTHLRTPSGRPLWHPYSPPESHRSIQRSSPSRTPSPTSDMSSNADANGQQPRSARPTYTEEEIYFIWYHRDDLGMGWNQVLEMFNTRFGKRERNGVQGIQCRYYRALEIHHVPKSRARDRSLPPEAYGVRQQAPEKWWPWMRQ